MGTARVVTALADRGGVPLAGANEQGAAAFNDAVECLLALAGDPVAGAEEAVAAAPGMVLGRVYGAYLSLYGTTAAGVAAAARILDEADGKPCTCRPRGRGQPGTGPGRSARWSGPWCCIRATRWR